MWRICCLCSGDNFDLSYGENQPSLSISLYHKGAFSVSEVPLGKVEINLEDIATNATEMWFPLKPDGRTTDVSGDLRLSLKFNIPPKDSDDDNNSDAGNDFGMF